MTTSLKRIADALERLAMAAEAYLREDVAVAATAPPARAVAKPKAPTIGTQVWETYRSAYLARHGVEPIRNAPVNSSCSRLAGLLGAETACQIVKYYLGRNDAYYLAKKHPISICLMDAQKLNTEMRTGQGVTMTEARRLEKTEETKSAIHNYLREQEGGPDVPR